MITSRKVLKQRDCFKRSLLHYAAMGDCTSLLHYLLQCDPDIDLSDMYRWTILSYAAEHSSMYVVRTLLNQGSKVNAIDYEGSTPLTLLIHAVNTKSKNLVATEAYLKERGAKEDTMRGVTAMQRIRSNSV